MVDTPRAFRPGQGAGGDPNWFVATLGKVTNAPVIRQILREFSRPGFVVGNLLEGDLKNALNVMIPFTDIDEDEATSVSDVILPKSSHWLKRLAVDIVTDPITWLGTGGISRLSVRLAGLTRKGEVARRATQLERALESLSGKTIKVRGPGGKLVDKTINTIEDLPDFARLEEFAAKAGVALKGPGGEFLSLGETFAEQAAKGHRALITGSGLQPTGRALIEGERVLKFASATSKLLGESKIPGGLFRLLRDTFTTANNRGALSIVNHVLLGQSQIRKNLLIKRSEEFRLAAKEAGLEGGKLSKFSSTMEEIRRSPLKTNEFGVPKDLEDALAKFPQDQRAAAEKMFKVVEEFGQLRKAVGIRPSKIGGKFLDQVQNKIPRETEKIFIKLAKKMSDELQPVLDRVRSAHDLVDNALKGKTELEKIQLLGAFMAKKRARLREIVGAGKGKKANRPVNRLLAADLNDPREVLRATGDIGVTLPAESIDEVKRIVDEMRVVRDAAIERSSTLNKVAKQMAPESRFSAAEIGARLTSANLDNVVDVATDVNISKLLSEGVDKSAIKTLQKQATKLDTLTKQMDDTPVYLHHVVTEEAMEFIRKQPGAKGKIFRSKEFIDNLARKFVDDFENGGSLRPLTIDEVNELFLMGKGLKGELAQKFRAQLAPRLDPVAKKLDRLIKEGKVKNMREAIDNGFMDEVSLFFETDPRAIIDDMAKKTVNATDRADHFQAIAKNFGVSTRKNSIGTRVQKTIPEGYRQIKAPHADIEGMFFRDDIANAIEKRWDFYTYTDVSGQWLRAFDQTQSFIKENLTIFFPGFLTRNKLSNGVLNVLSGMNPLDPRFVSTWIQSMLLGAVGSNPNGRFLGLIDNQALLKSPLMRMNLGGGRVVDGNEMLAIMARNRALDGSGFMNEFVAAKLGSVKRAQGAMNKMLRVVPEGYNRVKSKAMFLNGLVEDTDKMHHILYRMSVDGLDEFTAGQSAVATLFDYGDLTVIESQAGKRLFPFYSWSRKSIPSVVKGLAMNPSRLAAFKGFLQNTPVDDPIPIELIPSYITDSFGVPAKLGPIYSARSRPCSPRF
jgi:hypothetical protein